MKIQETDRTYAIELTERQAKKLWKRDERTQEVYDVVSGRYSYPKSILMRICKIDNVREVNYDPMFGPVVYVRIENPATYQETLEKVKKEIAQYVR